MRGRDRCGGGPTQRVRAARLTAGVGQQQQDLLVGDGCEVLVPHPHPVQSPGNGQADDAVGLLFEHHDRLAGAYGNSDHHPPCAALSHGAHRCELGHAGSHAVVDHDRGAPAEGDRSLLAVSVHPAAQLARLLLEPLVEQRLGHAEHACRARVKHAAAVLGDGADGQLGVAGRADLAHGHDLDRRVKRARYLHADRHAAARQGDDHRPLSCQRRQLLGQAPAAVCTVAVVHAAIILLSRASGVCAGAGESRAKTMVREASVRRLGGA